MPLIEYIAVYFVRPVCFLQLRLCSAEAVIVAKGDVRDVLDGLTRRSLLEWDTVARRYNLHDLVRAFGVQCWVTVKRVWLRYIEHYAHIAATTHQLYIQGGTHIEADFRYSTRNEGIWTRHGDGSSRKHLRKLSTQSLLAYADATTEIGALR